MIVTPHFVVLNFPKTGSSFVRKSVKLAYKKRASLWRKVATKLRLLDPECEEIFLPKIDEQRHAGLVDQHGTWRQVPEEYRGLDVVSVTRNPLDRYLSTYFYGWWKDNPPLEVKKILDEYPHFPELSFREYFEMMHLYGCRDRLGSISPTIPLGLHTIQFIQFFTRDPDSVLRRIDQRYVEDMEILNDMPSVHFLEQDNLNEDLKRYLVSCGFTASGLSWLDELDMVNVTDRRVPSGSDISSQYRLLLDEILERDQLIFRLFPTYLEGIKSKTKPDM